MVMRRIKLSLLEIITKEQFHNLLIDRFDLPDYYGRNLDAFLDCLRDIEGVCEIHIIGLDAVNLPLRKFINDYINVMRDFESEADGSFRLKIE